MTFSVLQSKQTRSLSVILSSRTFDLLDLNYCPRYCQNCLLYDTKLVVTLQQ